MQGVGLALLAEQQVVGQGVGQGEQELLRKEERLYFFPQLCGLILGGVSFT